MKTLMTIGMLTVFMLTFSIVPLARADTVPTPGTTDETQWVPSGPASDTIQIPFFGNTNAEFNAFQFGQLELTDAPLGQFLVPTVCSTGTSFWCTPPGACPSGQFGWAKGWQRVSIDSTSCIDNFFTLLNMWSPNPLVTGPTIRWGFSESTNTLNPYLATRASEFRLIAEIYDTLLQENPYDHTQVFSWIADPTTLSGAYHFVPVGGNCPVGAAECLSVSLQGDIVFQDGSYVFHGVPILSQLTASDVKFSYLSLIATGSSLGACLTANHITDVMFDPTVLPKNLGGGTEAPGQLETNVDIVFSALPSQANALSCLAQVPILPQHIWAKDTTNPCTVDGNQCLVDPGHVSGPGADPVANNMLIGSGPFLCGVPNNLFDSTGGFSAVGGGCTGSGTSAVSWTSPQLPFGGQGQIVLFRYGAGVSHLSGYFRTNGKYKEWAWAKTTVVVTEPWAVTPGGDFSAINSCTFNPAGAPCAHYRSPDTTLTCNTNAGPCIGTVSGGNGAVTGLQKAEVAQWIGTAWTAPFHYDNVQASTLTGVVPISPIIYDDGSQYS